MTRQIRDHYEPVEVYGRVWSSRTLLFADLVAILAISYLLSAYVFTWIWESWPVVERLYVFPVGYLTPVVIASTAWRLILSRGVAVKRANGRPRLMVTVMVLSLLFLAWNYGLARSYSPVPSRVLAEGRAYYEDVLGAGLAPISEASYRLARVREVRESAGFLLGVMTMFLLIPWKRSDMGTGEKATGIPGNRSP